MSLKPELKEFAKKSARIEKDCVDQVTSENDKRVLIVGAGEAGRMVVSEIASHGELGLSVVGFLDGGNVFLRAGSINLAQLRASAGLGLRYQSPIGPLRVDYGFKMDRRIVAGKR